MEDNFVKILFQQPIVNPKQGRSAGLAFTDTLVWQALASVIIPGFTINRVCWVTNKLLQSARTLPPMVRKWSTTVVGIGCIPLIVHPIDRSVDYLMDNSLRTWYNYHPRKSTTTKVDEI